MAVGITLETIAAPGATPITPNASSAKAFANDYYKLSSPSVSMQDTKGILINALIFLLNTAGGANYKTNHAGLIQDSTVYTGGISNFNFWPGLTAAAASAAHVGDGTFSYDVPTQVAQVRDLIDEPEQVQDRIIAFLFTQLGV